MPGNTPTGLLPTVLPGGSTDTGEHTSAGPPGGTAPGSSPAAASAAGSSTAAAPGAAGAAGAAARRRPGRPGRHAWYRLISPLAVLVIWQLVSSSGLVSEQKLPSPSTVLH